VYLQLLRFCLSAFEAFSFAMHPAPRLQPKRSDGSKRGKREGVTLIANGAHQRNTPHRPVV
jgi:hypothetical protein